MPVNTGMAGLPTPIVPPGSQPSVLNPLAQQFAAQHEAMRAPLRPTDAVSERVRRIPSRNGDRC